MLRLHFSICIMGFQLFYELIVVLCYSMLSKVSISTMSYKCKQCPFYEENMYINNLSGNKRITSVLNAHIDRVKISK